MTEGKTLCLITGDDELAELVRRRTCHRFTLRRLNGIFGKDCAFLEADVVLADLAVNDKSAALLARDFLPKLMGNYATLCGKQNYRPMSDESNKRLANLVLQGTAEDYGGLFVLTICLERMVPSLLASRLYTRLDPIASKAIQGYHHWALARTIDAAVDNFPSAGEDAFVNAADPIDYVLTGFLPQFGMRADAEKRQWKNLHGMIAQCYKSMQTGSCERRCRYFRRAQLPMLCEAIENVYLAFCGLGRPDADIRTKFLFRRTIEEGGMGPATIKRLATDFHGFVPILKGRGLLLTREEAKEGRRTYRLLHHRGRLTCFWLRKIEAPSRLRPFLRDVFERLKAKGEVLKDQMVHGGGDGGRDEKTP